MAHNVGISKRLRKHQLRLVSLEEVAEIVPKAWLWYIAPFMPAFIWELAIWIGLIDFNTAWGIQSFKMLLNGDVLLRAVLGMLLVTVLAPPRRNCAI